MTLVDYLRLGVWKKEFPYFVWYPFDAFDDQYFAYVYLSQTWAGFTTVFAMLAEVFIIGTLVLQFCIQFECISRSLREYRPSHATNNQFLRKTIAQHNFILDTAEEFADIISGTLFINQTCSSMVICFVGFQVVVGENLTVIIKFLLFLFCSLIHTIVVSYFGNEIMEYVRQDGRRLRTLMRFPFLSEFWNSSGGLWKQLDGWRQQVPEGPSAGACTCQKAPISHWAQVYDRFS